MSPPPPLGALELTVEAGDGAGLHGDIPHPGVTPADSSLPANLVHGCPATAATDAPRIQLQIAPALAALSNALAKARTSKPNSPEY